MWLALAARVVHKLCLVKIFNLVYAVSAITLQELVYMMNYTNFPNDTVKCFANHATIIIQWPVIL